MNNFFEQIITMLISSLLGGVVSLYFYHLYEKIRIRKLYPNNLTPEMSKHLLTQIHIELKQIKNLAAHIEMLIDSADS
jgi:sensor domain CHASE-containing protein